MVSWLDDLNSDILNTAGGATSGKIAIHTHDRIAYRRCRRKWQFVSPLKYHLVPKESMALQVNTWFGTGFHFGLEDYFGYNRFGHPGKAFMAYVDAFRPSDIPEGAQELIDIAQGMYEYFIDYWIDRRNIFKTVWLNGVPQVEVDFSIPIPELSEIAKAPVFYEGTFDRVVEDEYGRLWVMDYKTASRFNTSKLDLDPQITAYCWAAEKHYGVEIEGVVYLQFLKEVPQYPKILKDGTVSLDKRQKTTYGLYRKALLDVYGDASKFPQPHVQFLNELAEQETMEGDRYIRQDLVRRNEHQKQGEYQKILTECTEMLTLPDSSLYPNPTSDCSWDCLFRDVCICMEEGSDWEYILNLEYTLKEEDKSWRNRIKWPNHQR